MSDTDRIRWDEQHRQTQGSEQPSAFLREVIESSAWPLPRGRALDLACGQGRNSLYLAERGYSVVAVDISAVALQTDREKAEAKRLQIDWRQENLEQIDLGDSVYDLVINFNYLQRSLLPQMKTSLRTGGVAIYETYLIDQKEFGHPKNPDYLLGYNELLDWFRDFRVLYYREGKFSDGGEPAYRAGILAQKVG
jgi:2-polyprenyl-3-methyl-5-hydroxy-6-metoxy-1,4-benzoquinol methylase